ncbi:MAG TPA: hypothetical protein DCR83_05795 [Eubacterium sp.]|nr:hypothetical protein [Eubacterium sp.]HCO35618.1 hypothetical protein [Eubacterium sp.]
MKRYFCFILAVLITAMSIFLYCPFNIYANDAFTISKNSTEKSGLTADEAQKAIDANADIKGKDGVTMLLYTPSDSYNYTLKSGAFVAHLSDSQAKAMLMSKKSFQQYVVLCSSLISNGTVFRGFLKTVGIATTGDSDALTNIVDKFTCNYNYLDSINYDEDTQTITMDNTSVDKLREEIKNYYYQSVGIRFLCSSGDIKKAISTSYYDDMDLYTEDFKMLTDYDYAIYSKNWKVLFAFNKSDINYLYCTQKYYNDSSSTHDTVIRNVDKNLDDADLNISSSFNITPDNFSPCTIKSFGIYGSPYDVSSSSSLHHSYVAFDGVFGSDSTPDYFAANCFLYSKNDEDIMFFASYESLYNYIKSDQNAYLSKTINETGKDISLSIKDMDENLGSKMDTLIDTINDKKGSMSQEELQDAIDKGLAELNKNTEDIKDNTEEMNSKLDSVLEALNAQNETLLEILGVTKKIADTVDDINEKTDYNSIISTISTIFNAVQCALLYGQNTLKDSGSSAQAQAVSYFDDDIEVYSDSGGTYKPKVLNMDLRSGIFGHFPFSMIYHMYDWCAAFVAEAKAPVFTYNYGFLVGDKDNPELTVSIDLSQFEDWRDVAASFMRLSFTLAVAYGSYKRFKEEML